MRRIEQKQYIELISTTLRGIEKINTDRYRADGMEDMSRKARTDRDSADGVEDLSEKAREKGAVYERYDVETVAVMFSECLRAFAAIEEAVSKSVSDGRSQVYCGIINDIRKSVEGLAVRMDAGGDHIDSDIQGVKDSIEKLKQEILKEQEIESVILFLPYKASMWDSMESIWRSARNDPGCIVYVAPIPYFDKNPDGSFGEMHYEGNLMPDYVEIADCGRMDLELLKPDVIYIHNPYDHCNHVTSVHPAFYSAELKKYTQMLVYVPYSIPGVYESPEGAATFCQTLGMYHADVLIAQSQVHKTLLVCNGHKEEKIAVLGNPKFDYVLSHLKDCEIPDEMVSIRQAESVDENGSAGKGSMAGRKKVFLVCISVGSYLLWENIIEMYDMFIGCLLDQYHAAVIYRPHPLLETTIKTMRPHKYRQYMEFLDKYCSRADFVLDLLSDYIPAVCASDCMIGDYSSLCFSYAVTGKPVAMAIWGEAPVDNYYYAFDYREIYFINVGPFLAWKQLPESFEQFAADMVNGNDYKKEHRLESFRRSVENLDGTCGEKIHAYVTERI